MAPCEPGTAVTLVHDLVEKRIMPLAHREPGSLIESYQQSLVLIV